jgi:hypothetical protein
MKDVTIAFVKKITVKISDGLDAELQALARAWRMSKDRIVRDAIKERLRNAQSKSAPRAIDLVSKLQGQTTAAWMISVSERVLDRRSPPLGSDVSPFLGSRCPSPYPNS